MDAKLIVELDGSQHAQNQAADEARTSVLRSCGYRIVRYWNSDVLAETETVLEDISAHLDMRKWPIGPPPQSPTSRLAVNGNRRSLPSRKTENWRRRKIMP
ncbi:DUF559 domain-containing protein [Labrenzia aggregata]|uniref:DUF559 domain-containing protein n=1 Tax=Roseibium aggregatum TaxID=187304 RepID=A0A939J368_9HYPH|nr:DUF559 domain-containing protein [Roseibium aggregatum]